VAVSRNGHVKIIANEQGYRTTPTWVAFGDEERLVGTAVTNASHISPENTVFDAKRLIGRKMDDADVRKDMDMKQWPFKVDDKDGNPVFSVNHRDEQRDFTPQEITAMILSKMKDTAEAYLGENITYAAVTVPTCMFSST
jgi:heat shock protein 5